MTLKFSEYLLAEAAGNVDKLRHLEHLEEMLYHGVDSVRIAINTLRDIRDTLAGHSDRGIQLTRKLDGAPSCIVGYHPETGDFIVAKKSIFNQTPIFYRSQQDINNDTNLSPDLAAKFSAVLQWAPYVVPKGMLLQGDLMFTRADLQSENIDGKMFFTFHPNTLVYAVEQCTELGDRISNANLGIVFHTRYNGSTLADMTATIDVKTSDLLQNDNVFAVGPEIEDLSGTVTMTSSETADVTAILSQVGVLFNKVGSSILNQLAANPDLIIQIEAYNNSHIKAGQFITNSKKHVLGLIDYIHAKFQKEIDKKKTDTGKKNWANKRDAMLEFFDEKNLDQLVMFFDMMVGIVNAKLLLINQLNKIEDIKTFIKTKDGFVLPANGEGFVISDSDGKVMKLVDRLEFSKNNFSSDILKGWEK
jgi:hypothetical protein